MSVPPDGPCEEWVTKSELTACLEDPVPADAILQLACDYANWNLFRLSGKRYSGACTEELHHPGTGRDCSPLGGWDARQVYPSTPARIGGVWRNIDGRAQRPDSLKLPGPVTSISEVWVDGVQLTPEDDYRVAGWRELVRVWPHRWPGNADVTVDKDQANSFVIILVRGRPLADSMGGRIAKQMALIYAKERVVSFVCQAVEEVCGDLENEGIETMAADGVSISMSDLFSLSNSQGDARPNRTGIRVVDEWLGTINPKRRRSRPRVASADNPNRRAKRWTGTSSS